MNCAQSCPRKMLSSIIYTLIHIHTLIYSHWALLSVLWRHLTSNSHRNEWLPAPLHTHTHTRRLTNSACSSRTRLLILITEQRKTSIISLICLLSRKSRKWCSFYPGPVSSVYWSSSAQMEAEFSWVSVSVGVCVGVGKSGCRSLSDLSCKRDTVQGWIS